MTPTETIAFLRNYNVWRRGNLDDQPMPDPREIGKAIDAAIEMIDRLEAAEKERDAAELMSLALRAKIEQMEKQEPVAEIVSFGGPDLKEAAWKKGKMPAFGSKLYALPGAQNAPNFADAYQGAMEEVAIWKKRALEAEDLNRKFISEINGPTHMGEPVQPAPSVPDVDALAQFIREIDGKHQLGAGALAERIVEWLAAAPEAKP